MSTVAIPFAVERPATSRGFVRSVLVATFIAVIAGAFILGVVTGFSGGYLQGFDEGQLSGWRYGKDGNPANPPRPLAPWNQRP